MIKLYDKLGTVYDVGIEYNINHPCGYKAEEVAEALWAAILQNFLWSDGGTDWTDSSWHYPNI